MANVMYYIHVHGAGLLVTGSFSINVREVVKSCVGASGPLPTDGTLMVALNAGSMSETKGFCIDRIQRDFSDYLSGEFAGPAVWYSVVGTGTGTGTGLQASTCDPKTEIEMIVSVLSGDCSNVS
jgi:hypothetical protein